MSLRKKVENGAKKRHKTCVALFFFTIFAKEEEISKNYTYI
ncbi:hypothetical protein PREVCOP_04631 [Segatella copri DSM 18205]|uniref:Uncharacterized protein n=1 Tax=Segatella copri DSM 18205 TaxID=537011 RepID=D1PBQ1_9BACT|nr:hypothetical protein PREVCOP_04631 [Segatella copri DSM 18205]